LTEVRQEGIADFVAMVKQIEFVWHPLQIVAAVASMELAVSENVGDNY
jgi:hypothetical protein